MKRSQINNAIVTAEKVLKDNSFYLPPFSRLTPEEWMDRKSEYDYIAKNKLGWDVTDFGGDDFTNFGAVLFTIRNGDYKDPQQGTPYAEKVIILMPGQRLPLHFHWVKTEDIINRGGGIISMQLFNSLVDDSIDNDSEVCCFCDGVEKKIEAGRVFNIMPGESVTLKPGIYHRFWAKKDSGMLVCGEVSSINDDVNDNKFAEPVERFSVINEDERPLRLLCNEY